MPVKGLSRQNSLFVLRSIKSFDIGEIDADASFGIEKQILTDEIDDSEFLNFAIENFDELFSYIASGIINR